MLKYEALFYHIILYYIIRDDGIEEIKAGAEGCMAIYVEPCEMTAATKPERDARQAEYDTILSIITQICGTSNDYGGDYGHGAFGKMSFSHIQDLANFDFLRVIIILMKF